MLIFFFILVFLAEVKLTVDIVRALYKFDKKVCALNSNLTISQEAINKNFTSLRLSLNKILLILNNIQLKIKEKKLKYRIIIAKNLLSWIIFALLNTNGKKILSVIDLGYSVIDFAKKWK